MSVILDMSVMALMCLFMVYFWSGIGLMDTALALFEASIIVVMSSQICV